MAIEHSRLLYFNCWKKMKYKTLWCTVGVCHPVMEIQTENPRREATYRQIYSKIPHGRFGLPLRQYLYYCTKPQQNNSSQYLRSTFPHTVTQTLWITLAFYDETNASNLFQKPNESFSTSKTFWISPPPTALWHFTFYFLIPSFSFSNC